MAQRRPLSLARIARLEAERELRQGEAAKQRANWRHYLYFLACEGHVKIGFGRDPVQRCAAAQVGNPFPVTLVAIATGGEKEERVLHRVFRHLHVRAEWFRLAPPLDTVVSHLRDEPPDLARAWLGEWLLSFNGSTALLSEEPHKNGHMEPRITPSAPEISLQEQQDG